MWAKVIIHNNRYEPVSGDLLYTLSTRCDPLLLEQTSDFSNRAFLSIQYVAAFDRLSLLILAAEDDDLSVAHSNCDSICSHNEVVVSNEEIPLLPCVDFETLD